MGYIIFAVCLILETLFSITTATTTTVGGRIVFPDSSESEKFNIDERPRIDREHRNHRGHGRGHHRHIDLSKFEEGLPGEYPILGPPPPPFVPATGRGEDGIAIKNFPRLHEIPGNPLPETQTLQQPQYSPYANNPFLSKFGTSTVATGKKYNHSLSPSVTNLLPPSDKPASTTTPPPRRTDLLHGSNLLEEGQAQFVEKASKKPEIVFDDRGLFDTAPHCRRGYILVRTRCRLAV